MRLRALNIADNPAFITGEQRRTFLRGHYDLKKPLY
ncbi:hypothetical protein SAMN05216516_104146 [Izhakiella capsodis]|uniref:Uncharacterized protein n=1 Tax=Izhakiella capsodis TaxID=1367852 RepID=A0A1I4XI09_9GAMM|nr:hypothetical protein SAMN05216516_104146 [Izhakiella capsodis]